MYERFTDRARKVMQLAGQEARRLNHEYVGTEHLLLGLVAEGAGVAANVLRNLGVDLRAIRAQVERVVGLGPAEQVVMSRLPHTPGTKLVFGYAAEEARHLNHNYVGTEHLLLGLLREQGDSAARALARLGLKLERVRQEVLDLLDHNAPPAQVVVADALADALNEPAELTPEQLRLVRERVRTLNDQADCSRAEAAALESLLAWYVRGRESR